MANLPHEVRTLLGANRAGRDGVAEEGQDFNATDVLNGDLPMRRFVIAGVSKDCVVVAVEKGGRGYSVRRVVYRQTDSEWFAEEAGGFWRKPESPTALVATGNF